MLHICRRCYQNMIVEWTVAQRFVVSLPATTHLHVESCPGAGKTTTLAERVSAVIGRGEVDAKQVAVVTYTNAAVEVLKAKVCCDDVFIGTIHSFAKNLLGEAFANHVIIGEAQW